MRDSIKVEIGNFYMKTFSARAALHKDSMDGIILFDSYILSSMCVKVASHLQVS